MRGPLSILAATAAIIMPAAAQAQVPIPMPPPPPRMTMPAPPGGIAAPPMVAPAAPPMVAPPSFPGPGAANASPPSFPAMRISQPAPALAAPAAPPVSAPSPAGSGAPALVPGARAVPAAGQAPAGTYQNAAHHFGFVPPAGWIPINLAVFQAVGAPSGVHYEAGFRQNSLPAPYLLVQVEPAPPGNPAGQMDSFAQRARQSLGDPNATVSWDDRRKAFVVHATLNMPAYSPVALTTFAFVGKSEVVFLHCYAQPELDGDTRALFEQVADSFRFDPGSGYDSRDFLGLPSAPIFAGARDGALYGGIAGAMVGLVVAIFRRKQPR